MTAPQKIARGSIAYEFSNEIRVVPTAWSRVYGFNAAGSNPPLAKSRS